MTECLVCRELAGEILPGGFVHDDELVAGPRYRGTPPDHVLENINDWEGAPRGGGSEIADVVARMRSAYSGSCP